MFLPLKYLLISFLIKFLFFSSNTVIAFLISVAEYLPGLSIESTKKSLKYLNISS